MATFSLTLDRETEKDLSRLAKTLERRRGDAVRFAIRRELERQAQTPRPTPVFQGQAQKAGDA